MLGMVAIDGSSSCFLSDVAVCILGPLSLPEHRGTWRHPGRGRFGDSGYWNFLEKTVKRVSQNCNFIGLFFRRGDRRMKNFHGSAAREQVSGGTYTVGKATEPKG